MRNVSFKNRQCTGFLFSLMLSSILQTNKYLYLIGIRKLIIKYT
jgi:hypothetical protein